MYEPNRQDGLTDLSLYELMDVLRRAGYTVTRDARVEHMIHASIEGGQFAPAVLRLAPVRLDVNWSARAGVWYGCSNVIDLGYGTQAAARGAPCVAGDIAELLALQYIDSGEGWGWFEEYQNPNVVYALSGWRYAR